MGGAQTIDALVAEFAEAWNRHDMTAWGQLYSENADFVNIFGEWCKGREQIAQEHADLHKTVFRTSELSIQWMNVRMLRPDIAIMHLHWLLVNYQWPVPESSGFMIHVLEQSNGIWYIAATQNTKPVART